jgi:uncharacterized membrane protein
MIVFTNPIALLLTVPLFALAILIWRHGYINLSSRRQTMVLAVRLALLAAIVLGLAGASLRLPQSRQAVVFVADLSNSDVSGSSSMQALINAALSHRPSGDVAGIVSVGHEPMVEQPVAPLTSFDGFQTSPDPNYTNLQSGLELANAILPDGYRHRIVLLTDGQQNIGDALSTVRLLRSQGVRIDVVPVHVPTGPEVLVDSVDIPSQLRPREHFSLTVSLRSTVNTTTELDVYRDQTLVLSRREPVRVGEDQYVFAQPPLHPGFHTYRVVITPARDTQPENNTGSAFTSVQGPPRVLVIASARREAANVLTSLRSTGLRADLMLPVAVAPTLSFLQRYAAIVIVDTPADVLGPDLIAQLVPYVRDVGHGLVVIGGEEAYGMGGYGQTPLEQVLPVSMELPKRKDLPSAAVALIIESLEEDTQINISKEAGKGVINLLTPRDFVAVNDAPFDGSSGWVVPLQHVVNKGAIDHAIDGMEPGDPISYAPYLQSAYGVLKHAHARVKHIILLGDGDAEDPNYKSVVKRIRAGGVTVSTVATNGMGFNDFATMQNIARWGGGRYYRADNPNNIPKIFLREAHTVARSGIIEGKFYPQELSANPMLRDLHGVAPLYGYVATTPKPTGEMVLTSQKLDPILAAWQFGLGRAVAWTSDAAGLWTKDWLRAPGANRFWADLVSWTLPTGQGHQLFVNAQSVEGQGRISVDTPPSLGADPTVTARITDPTFHVTQIQLQPSGPGHYHGSFPANARGAYLITVEAQAAGRAAGGQVSTKCWGGCTPPYAHSAEHAAIGQAGLAVSYSAEYRTTGTNMPFLHALAAAGDGSIITQPQAAWLNNLHMVFAQQSLSTILWLLALLLLPIDIGLRRLVVSRRDLAAIIAALPFAQYHPAETAVAPLNALRTRRVQWRARSRGSANVAAGTIVSAATAESVARPIRTATSKPQNPNPSQSAKTPTSPAPQSQTPSTESTASRLLAAKRRRT